MSFAQFDVANQPVIGLSQCYILLVADASAQERPKILVPAPNNSSSPPDPRSPLMVDAKALALSAAPPTGFDHSRYLRAAVISAFSLCLLWICISSVIWWVSQLRGFRSVGYPDVALPWRWSDALRKQGEDLISQGRVLALNARMEEAIRCVAAGVARTHSRDGYFLLSELQSAQHQESVALDSLLTGLSQAFVPDRAYLDRVFECAVQADNPAAAVQAARRCWEADWGETHRTDRSWLAGKVGHTLLRQGEWAAALDWANGVQLSANDDSLLDIQVRAQINLGRQQAAIQALLQPPREAALPAAERLALLAEAYYRAGEFRQTANALQLSLSLSQDDFSRYLQALQVIEGKPELEQERDKVLKAYWNRFSLRESAMVALAAFLSERHATPELQRLYEHARGHSFALNPFVLPLAEAQIFAGKLPEAESLLAQFDPRTAEPALGNRAAALRLLGAALAGKPGEEIPLLAAKSSLQELLDYSNLLVQQGRSNEARQLIQASQPRYPNSARLLAQLRALSAPSN